MRKEERLIMDKRIYNGANKRVYVMATPKETKSFVYYSSQDYVCAFKCKGTLEPSEENVKCNAIAGAIDMVKFLQGDILQKETPIVFFVNDEIVDSINHPNYRRITNDNELNYWKEFDRELEVLMKKKQPKIIFAGLGEPQKIVESGSILSYLAERDIKVIKRLANSSPIHWKQVWDLYIV